MTDSDLPTPDTAAGKRRRRLLLRKRFYQRLWGGRAANETPVVVFLAGTPDIANGHIISALEANFDTDLYRAGDPRVFEDQRLRPDDDLRQLIRKSRAPAVIFVAGGESDSMATLIERFSPARVLWFYEPLTRFVERAPRALDETTTRRLLAARSDRDDDALPAPLALFANSQETDVPTIWALAWYVIHDAYRRQRLGKRGAAHLISERALIAAPGATLDGIFEIVGVGARRNKQAPRIRTKRQRFSDSMLPEPVREACAELQGWLDAHAEDPADLA
ncbi:hypothetical protein [Salinisphaera hydrothermalis]|uniref:Uncharacterized protein n=1 Tax=Salinisphaera hydrothermalis (strain C41B8) TaxID=1304275 RepID=A0A084IME5_SALHC|nr:hypothetical protein [Salinisphaera hydrothermalis]KEZ77879.1 hypothetical protein C41B8_07527 [Salinisphaera hydrothermalis C41B8]